MNQEASPAAKNGKEFSILRIYLKDVSFETPHSPAIFTQNWKPSVDMDLHITINSLEENFYEIILTITVAAQGQEKVGWLAEIQQAGVFNIAGYEGDHLDSVLSAYCPHALYPYAREAISDLVTKGGFPPYLLAPVNFQELHKEKQQQLANQAEAGS